MGEGGGAATGSTTVKGKEKIDSLLDHIVADYEGSVKGEISQVQALTQAKNGAPPEGADASTKQIPHLERHRVFLFILVVLSVS